MAGGGAPLVADEGPEGVGAEVEQQVCRARAHRSTTTTTLPPTPPPTATATVSTPLSRRGSALRGLASARWRRRRDTGPPTRTARRAQARRVEGTSDSEQLGGLRAHKLESAGSAAGRAKPAGPGRSGRRSRRGRPLARAEACSAGGGGARGARGARMRALAAMALAGRARALTKRVQRCMGGARVVHARTMGAERPRRGRGRCAGVGPRGRWQVQAICFLKQPISPPPPRALGTGDEEEGEGHVDAVEVCA